MYCMENKIKNALHTVINPFTQKTIVPNILAVRMTNDSVHLTIHIDSAMDKAMQSRMKMEIVSAITPITDARVKVLFTAETHKKDAGIANVKHMVAIASGKGGVGKSTTALNLAYALQNKGMSVGILDADVFGPSIPHMAGANKPYGVDKGAIIPVNCDGIKAISMGFLVAQDTPIVWRGPMVMGAIDKLLHDVRWGTLDILIVDMPPGTGDVQLSLSKNKHLSGAVIVSTPQDVALLDAKKAMAMFDKVHVPILGMIENMSVFMCPKCNHPSHIFGTDGTRHHAQKHNIPLLGEIPLHLDIRTTMDAGMRDDSVVSYYTPVAHRLYEILSTKKR